MASEMLGNAAEKAKGLVGEKTGKMAQLAAVTKDVHDDKWRITTDAGVKQSNTDDWLSVATDNQQGPSLLEDHAAREKVSTLFFATQHQGLTILDPPLRPRAHSRACCPRPWLRCFWKVQTLRVR
jgi:hypothetical protein